MKAGALVTLLLAAVLIPIRPLNLAASERSASTLVFAVIGDYGVDNAAEAAVAAMVAGWNPDLVITTGDDYYSSAGGAGSGRYDESTGAHYCAFLKDISTSGSRCPAPGSGGPINRFFPSLGNHDYSDAGMENNLPVTYTDYFTLPGAGYTSTSANERYYDFVAGPVHFFAANSNAGSGQEPDGVSSASAQATWLRTQLAASTAPWKVVYFHHAAYSSGAHGSNTWMQWPFSAWGADAVFSGHDHHYERIRRDGMIYFVNGAGGSALYPTFLPVSGSEFRYNSSWGAQKVTVTPNRMLVEFYSTDQGETWVDGYTILKAYITSSNDDAEQCPGDGSVYPTNTDLELVDDSVRCAGQIVGLRFNGVNIPSGIPLVAAMVKFREDLEVASEVTDLLLYGQAADNPIPFSTTPYDLTNRPRSTAEVTWNAVPPWTAPGELKHTPNLAAVVQEIINRPGWAPGNSLVIMVQGSGRRTAVSYDGIPAGAPFLRLEYVSGPPLDFKHFLPLTSR